MSSGDATEGVDDNRSMSMIIKIGTVVLGDYEVVALIRANPIYEWVEAIARSTGERLLLQILQAGVTSAESDALIDYFERLQGMRSKGIQVPLQVLSGEGAPLVVVYPYLTTIPLARALADGTEKLQLAVSEASGLLFALHRNLPHGGLRPNSFVIAAGTLRITDFGYAPLLESGHKLAVAECKDWLPPETLHRQEVTKASDIYGFARSVAVWQPELCSTPWYEQATHLDPTARFTDMRATEGALQKALEALKTAPGTRAASSPATPKGGLVVKPSHNVYLEARPGAGGSYSGDGTYAPGETVTIQAHPHKGWSFDHWSGDVSGPSNPATVILNADKTVVAHFTEVLAATVGTPIKPSSAPTPATVVTKPPGVSSSVGSGSGSGSGTTAVGGLLPAEVKAPPGVDILRRFAYPLIAIGTLLLMGFIINTRSNRSQTHLATPAPPITPTSAATVSSTSKVAEQEADLARSQVQAGLDDLLTVRQEMKEDKITNNEIAAARVKIAAQFQLALEHSQKAIALDNTNELAWIQKTRAEYYLARYQEAKATIGQAMQQFADSPDLKDLQNKVNAKLLHQHDAASPVALKA